MLWETSQLLPPADFNRYTPAKDLIPSPDMKKKQDYHWS